MHKRITKKKFPRRKVIVRYPYFIFQADLLELKQSLKYHNDRFSFILVIIDAFSRKLWTEPMKNKKAISTAEAFEKIFKSLPKYPSTIQVDRGKEFWNVQVEAVLKKYGIMLFSTKSIIKASMAERVIQTIRNRLEKYMTKHKSKRWVEYLPKLVDNYNETPHSSIGMAPNHVTEKNRQVVFNKLNPFIKYHIHPRLSKGDKVRVLRSKLLFEKSSTKNWTDEIYTIDKVFQKSTIEWYKLTDQKGELLPGIFYYPQLNLVDHVITSGDHGDKR